MDRVLNAKDDKKTLYAIYRACRLCGAGAGYKMPIIQSFFNLESDGLELSQKIRECIQIEVSATDRMPPLICELCVDKVIDLYEFRALCRETDRRTRRRLGLPPPAPGDSGECENCRLQARGSLNTDSDVEQVSGQRSKKAKKESVERVKIKVERERESGRSLSSRSPTPDARRRRSPAAAQRRTTRQNTHCNEVQLIDETTLPEPKRIPKRTREKEETPSLAKKAKLPEPKPKETPKPGPKSRKPTKEPETPKTLKDAEPPKTTSRPKPASKKETKPSPPSSKPSRTKPEPVKPKPEEPVKPKPAETKHICQICNHQVKTSQGLSQHRIGKHVPTFTAAKLACNACELWFPTTEECAAHHRAHRDGAPYKCLRCYGYFKLQQEYDSHFGEKLCLSVYEVPDVACWRCARRFATGALLAAHRCAGEDARPGGRCSKCNKSYSLLKNQLKHEETCTYKKKGEVTIEPEVQARLLNMQVKISRCDALLTAPRVRVAALSHKYGLDSKARYPYLPACVKREPPTEASLKANHMVAINDSVKAEYWGSDSNDSQKVDSLTAMTLKTINRVDKVDDNDDLAKKIFSIIDNLAADDAETSFIPDNIEKDSDKKQSDGESGEKDNVSQDNDNSQGGSDSIIDRNVCISEDPSQVDDNSDKMEVVKDVPESESVVSGDECVNSAVADVKSDETNVDSDSITANDKMDVDAEKLDDSPKKSEASSAPIEHSEKMDVDCEKSDVSIQNIKCVESDDKIRTELDKRLSGSDDKHSDKIDQLNEETDVTEKDDTEKATHEAIKAFHDNLETSEDSVKTSQNDIVNEEIRIGTSQGTDEKVIDEENSDETKHFSAVNDNSSKNEDIDRSNQATQDCSLDFNNDKFENDRKGPDNSDVNVFKTEKIDVNPEETYPLLTNNEVFSKIDEITNKILKETETAQNNSADEHTAIENTQRSDNHSDSISLNSLKSANDIELQDKFNVDDLSDDDKKLMAELDAQIGEINDNHQKNDDVTSNDENKESDQKATENDDSGNYNDNDGVNDNSGLNDIAGKNDNCDERFTDVTMNSQHDPSSNQINGNGSNDPRRDSDQKSKDYLIDNLLRKQDDLKSLELDSISDDEFNFDA